MSYPWPLSTRADVEIDADKILDYVRDNKEWFVEKLQCLSPEREVLREMVSKLRDILDSNDYVRRIRDSSHSFEHITPVKLYNDLVDLKKYVESQI